MFDEPVVTASVPNVAQLATRIRRALAGIPAGWVEGEVQKINLPASGHCYIELADEDAKITAVIWRSRLEALKPLPARGSLVQAHYTRVDYYPKHGQTSIHVDQIRLTGVGELLRRRAETLQRLEADGLTDPTRKRRVPPFPRRVGVIAAQGSEALADVIKALHERFAPIDISFTPALVEGVNAVDSMIDALIRLQGVPELDVIVLARGGGGVRELVPFDDERLCRAISACTVPVVTAVGHTQQSPNCDHVAAACATVPARTAEIVVPSARELGSELDRILGRLDALPRRLTARAEDVSSLLGRVPALERIAQRRALVHSLLAGARPRDQLSRRATYVDWEGANLSRAAASVVDSRLQFIARAHQRLVSVPHELPSSDAIRLVGQNLDAVAAHYFTARRDELDRDAAGLARGRARVPTAGEIEIDAAALRVGGRQGMTRLCSYTRAFDRLAAEAGRGSARRLKRETARLDAVASELPRRAQARLRAVRTSILNLLRLVHAKDIRSRGWLLAVSGGKPVTRAAGLSINQQLELLFVDGEIGASVQSVNVHKENSDE